MSLTLQTCTVLVDREGRGLTQPTHGVG
jgi:hypothetical protein